MKDQMPNNLPSGRGSLSKAGASPEPGGVRYMDMASGKPTTVFEGLSINTGPRFILIAVKGNQALNRVRVEHQAIYGGERVAVGDSLLVGGITMTEQGAVATLAWPFRAPDSRNGQQGGTQRPTFIPPPRPARRAGTVSSVLPGYAWILEDGSGVRRFGHSSQFTGAQMRIGLRVDYMPGATERGEVALDIKRLN